MNGAALAFRAALIDRIKGDRTCERFFYVDRDTCVGVCPVCDGPISVRFRGDAPRAVIECHQGCGRPELVAAFPSPIGEGLVVVDRVAMTAEAVRWRATAERAMDWASRLLHADDQASAKFCADDLALERAA